jgi:hypothetical protein
MSLLPNLGTAERGRQLIDKARQCEHADKVYKTKTRANRRIQYVICQKCGRTRKNVIILPETAFEIRFSAIFAYQYGT